MCRPIARSGQSICRTNPASRDRLVLVAHGVGDGEEIGLVAGVVVVAEEERDDAGRGGAHERILGRVTAASAALRFSTSACAAAGSRTLIGPLQAGVLRRERPGSPNTRLANLGKSTRSRYAKRLARAAESVEAILDVGGVARLAHLAVVDDVDARVAPACRRLPPPPPGCARRARPGRPARPPPWRTSSGSGRRPRQAAGVRGEEALEAALHRVGLPKRMRAAQVSALGSITVAPQYRRSKPRSRVRTASVCCGASAHENVHDDAPADSVRLRRLSPPTGPAAAAASGEMMVGCRAPYVNASGTGVSPGVFTGGRRTRMAPGVRSGIRLTGNGINPSASAAPNDSWGPKW